MPKEIQIGWRIVSREQTLFVGAFEDEHEKEYRELNGLPIHQTGKERKRDLGKKGVK